MNHLVYRMEYPEGIAAYSDCQGIDNDDFVSVKVSENKHANHVINKDDESDIYFDRTPFNEDEVSHYNVSNYPKEINLNIDQTSHWPILPEWKTPSHHTLSHLKLRVRQYSRCFEADNLDLDTQNFPPDSEVILNDDQYFKANHDRKAAKEEAKEYENGYARSFIKYDRKYVRREQLSENIQKSSFNKNDNKLIFKITRINRSTQKEKIITKSRRIITNCPHTSMKYYAKGMCKKCYHNHGREKKATECEHTDKPLYARGHCKQWYLSKYKEKNQTDKRNKRIGKDPVQNSHHDSDKAPSVNSSDGVNSNNTPTADKVHD